jgi:hypothetical protein
MVSQLANATQGADRWILIGFIFLARDEPLKRMLIPLGGNPARCLA